MDDLQEMRFHQERVSHRETTVPPENLISHFFTSKITFPSRCLSRLVTESVAPYKRDVLEDITPVRDDAFRDNVIHTVSKTV